MLLVRSEFVTVLVAVCMQLISSAPSGLHLRFPRDSIQSEAVQISMQNNRNEQMVQQQNVQLQTQAEEQMRIVQAVNPQQITAQLAVPQLRIAAIPLPEQRVLETAAIPVESEVRQQVAAEVSTSQQLGVDIAQLQNVAVQTAAVQVPEQRVMETAVPVESEVRQQLTPEITSFQQLAVAVTDPQQMAVQNENSQMVNSEARSSAQATVQIMDPQMPIMAPEPQNVVVEIENQRVEMVASNSQQAEMEMNNPGENFGVPLSLPLPVRQFEPMTAENENEEMVNAVSNSAVLINAAPVEQQRIVEIETPMVEARVPEQLEANLVTSQQVAAAEVPEQLPIEVVMPERVAMEARTPDIQAPVIQIEAPEQMIMEATVNDQLKVKAVEPELLGIGTGPISESSADSTVAVALAVPGELGVQIGGSANPQDEQVFRSTTNEQLPMEVILADNSESTQKKLAISNISGIRLPEIEVGSSEESSAQLDLLPDVIAIDSRKPQASITEENVQVMVPDEAATNVRTLADATKVETQAQANIEIAARTVMDAKAKNIAEMIAEVEAQKQIVAENLDKLATDAAIQQQRLAPQHILIKAEEPQQTNVQNLAVEVRNVEPMIAFTQQHATGNNENTQIMENEKLLNIAMEDQVVSPLMNPNDVIVAASAMDQTQQMDGQRVARFSAFPFDEGTDSEFNPEDTMRVPIQDDMPFPIEKEEEEFDAREEMEGEEFIGERAPEFAFDEEERIFENERRFPMENVEEEFVGAGDMEREEEFVGMDDMERGEAFIGERIPRKALFGEEVFETERRFPMGDAEDFVEPMEREETFARMGDMDRNEEFIGERIPRQLGEQRAVKEKMNIPMGDVNTEFVGANEMVQRKENAADNTVVAMGDMEQTENEFIGQRVPRFTLSGEDELSIELELDESNEEMSGERSIELTGSAEREEFAESERKMEASKHHSSSSSSLTKHHSHQSSTASKSSASRRKEMEHHQSAAMMKEHTGHHHKSLMSENMEEELESMREGSMKISMGGSMEEESLMKETRGMGGHHHHQSAIKDSMEEESESLLTESHKIAMGGMGVHHHQSAMKENMEEQSESIRKESHSSKLKENMGGHHASQVKESMKEHHSSSMRETMGGHHQQLMKDSMEMMDESSMKETHKSSLAENMAGHHASQVKESMKEHHSSSMRETMGGHHQQLMKDSMEMMDESSMKETHKSSLTGSMGMHHQSKLTEKMSAELMDAGTHLLTGFGKSERESSGEKHHRKSVSTGLHGAKEVSETFEEKEHQKIVSSDPFHGTKKVEESAETHRSKTSSVHGGLLSDVMDLEGSLSMKNTHSSGSSSHSSAHHSSHRKNQHSSRVDID